MANDQTRANLRDRAREIADRVGSTFATDTEINKWIDDEGWELHDILVSKFEEYFDSSASTAVVAGTSTYALPTNFYKLQYADLILGGHTYTLRRFMNRERNRYQDVSSILGQYDYRILGSNIRLAPTPTSSGTLVVGFVPQYTPFAADGTLVNSAVPQGWEAYIAMGAAAKILIKEESDAGAVMALKGQLLDRITQMAEDRDVNESGRIVDVSNRFGWRDTEEGWWM